MTQITSMYQKAVATNMLHEYEEAVRGYFPKSNYASIEAAFKKLPAEAQAAAIHFPDGRYVV